MSIMATKKSDSLKPRTTEYPVLKRVLIDGKVLVPGDVYDGDLDGRKLTLLIEQRYLGQPRNPAASEV
jgi:hypothetical protein